MGNRFYEPGAERGARVGELFSAIAARYDFLNDVQSFGLHRYWKHWLVREAMMRPWERALDLCCGTGDIGFLLAGQGQGGCGKVMGLDFSLPMLREGMKRRAAGGRGGQNSVSFAQGDASCVPCGDETCDLVTIGYGLRNLPDYKAGLREILRVLKPGGRLLVLEFGKPENAIWRTVYFGYLRGFVPLLGRLLGGNREAYAYILESLLQYPSQREVAVTMGELGFGGVDVTDFMGGAMAVIVAVKEEG